MKVRLFGFHLVQGSVPLPWDDFHSHLGTIFPTEIAHRGSQQILCFSNEPIDGFLPGLLVTARDQKLFSELVKEGAVQKLSMRPLQGGARLADFNFFVIHAATHRGIYQHYHKSCSLDDFFALLESQFEIRKTRAGLGTNEDCSLTGTPHFMRGEFEALLRELDGINGMTFSASTLVSNEPRFRTMKDAISVVTEKVTFKQGFLSQKITGILDLSRNKSVKRLRVRGMRPGEIEAIITPRKNKSAFGEFDFDAFFNARGPDLDLTAFKHAPMIAELIAAGRSRPEVFGVP